MGRKKKEGEEPKKPRARRDYGTGSISQLKDGRYRGAYYHEGKRYYVYTEKGANRSECQRLLQSAILKAQRGELVPIEKMTVEQYLTQWLTIDRRLTYRANSYAHHETAINNHIVPAFGHVPLQKLTGRHIQRWVNQMSDEKGLAPKTILGYHNMLHIALEDAVKTRKLASNPCQHINLPPVETPERMVLDIEQAHHLLDILEGHWLRNIVLLALATAMRRSEVLALRWADVDLKVGTLRIRHNLAYIRRVRFVEGPPKTKSSERVITLPEFALDMLKKHRIEQNAKRLEAVEWEDKDLVFAGRKGDFIRFTTVDCALKKALKAADLPMISFHNLRHSSASILLSLGVPPKVVQEIMGHSSITMTMDLYGHLFPGMQEQAMQKMDTAFKKEAF